MGLDRPSIEKRDFPVRRRGYDPDAVAAHLTRLADEVEAQSAAAPARPESLAGAASDRVRTIVEAAERSAGELRAEAHREGKEHLERVARATASMLERLDGIEHDLQALLEPIRAGATRLIEELHALEGAAQELRPEPPASRAPDEPSPPAAPAPASAPDDDDEGARLIALNMALNGTPREETERYLAENFGTVDRRGMLDDVYARAGR